MKRFLLFLILSFSIARLFAEPGDENWGAGFTLPPGVDGPVSAFAAMGHDLYVGGSFLIAGDLTVNGLARWDGTNWHSVGDGVHGNVLALAVSGTNLYVGGEFDRAGGLNATNLACWSGNEWRVIGNVTGQGFAHFGNFRVITLLASGSGLYVGGNFQEVSGVAATNIARWDGTNWFALGTGLGSRGGQVNTLALRGSQLFAGGLFLNAGDVSANNVARWNGKAWQPMGAGLTGGGRVYGIEGLSRSGVVESLAFRHGVLFVGGQFDRAGHQHATNLSRWVAGHWLPMGIGIGTSSTASGVSSLVMRGNDLYVAGLFERANRAAVTNLARWNGRRWFDVGGGINGDGVLTFIGEQLYMGGDFGVAGGVSVGHVARWNGNYWSALGAGQGNTIMGIPITIAVSEEKVFVAGLIHTAGTNGVKNVACWNGKNWSALGDGIPNGAISSSAVCGTNYYVAGDFIIPQVGATNVACWNGNKWQALGTGVRYHDSPGRVGVVAAADNLVYILGFFTSVGGVAATNLAVWNGTNWSAIGHLRYGPFTPLFTGLAARPGELYVAGIFGAVAGNEDSVVQWDGANWNSRWSRAFAHSLPFLRTLSFAGENLYALGQFTEAPSVTATNLARWDGTDWSHVGQPFVSEDEVICVTATTNFLYTGGNFTAAAGQSATAIARYDGTNWSGLGRGLIDRDGRGYVSGLAASGRKIYAIGYFRTADGKPSYRFGVWNEPD